MREDDTYAIVIGTSWPMSRPLKKRYNRVQQILHDIRACSHAIEKMEGKTRKEAWLGCTNGSWLMWIIYRLSKLGYLEQEIYETGMEAYNARANGVPRYKRMHAAVPFARINAALTLAENALRDKYQHLQESNYD